MLGKKVEKNLIKKNSKKILKSFFQIGQLEMKRPTIYIPPNISIRALNSTEDPNYVSREI